MKVKAISLFSGGLDSILAAKLISDLDIDVLGVTFETPFFSALKAIAAAERIALPLSVMNITEEHLMMLKSPRYGFGKNMNPCIDCHTLMLKIAGHKMVEYSADFIFTGEVLGQRPMSQTKQSLHIVAKNSGFADFILRPLSAKLLPETIPEREGKVDRKKLLSIQGRGRKQQMKMAVDFGITNYSPPAGGCLLTDPTFARRLKDLFSHQHSITVKDIELLKYGRHFRIDENTKVIVGRHKDDNACIEKLSDSNDIRLCMKDYPGPTTMLIGDGSYENIVLSASLCSLYSDAPKDDLNTLIWTSGGLADFLKISAADREDAKRLMI